MILPALVLFALAVSLIVYGIANDIQEAQKRKALQTPARGPSTGEAFSRARNQTNSWLDQKLLSISQPLAKSDAVQQARSSSFGRHIHELLLAAGGNVLGGSTEVFFATQLVATLVAGGLVMATFFGVMSPLIGLTVAAMAIYYPYNKVKHAATTRRDEVTEQLPEFADLLQMPLTAGNPVLSSLKFTADRTEGPVSQEVQRMLKAIRSRRMTEAEAFEYAAKRLGTPEARSFFTALLQAQLEGSRVIDNLKGQAEALRTVQYQRKRSEAKKMPVKLILMMAMHFLPLLFIVALIPAMVGLTQI